MTRVWVACVVLLACKHPPEPPKAELRIDIHDERLEAAQIDQRVREVVLELLQLPNVTRVDGVSAQGYGTIVVESDVAVDRIRDRVATRVHNNVPTASMVIVHYQERIASYVVRAPQLDAVALSEWVEQTSNGLGRLVGVGNLVACGVASSSRTLDVEVDPKRLAAFDVTAGELIAATRHAPDDLDQLRQLRIGRAQLDDLATFARRLLPAGCRARDANGPVIVVDVHGYPSARENVAAAIKSMAAPGIEVVLRPSVERYVVAISSDQVATLLPDGVVARIGDPDVLAQDVLLEVPADRAAAVRAQLRERGVQLLDPAAKLVWLVRDDVTELAPAAIAIAQQLGALPPPTIDHRWLDFDVARIRAAGVAVPQQERDDIQELVTDGLRINDKTLLRIAPDVVGELPIARSEQALVPLAQLATVQAVQVPQRIWRLAGRAAIAIRPPSSAALDTLARDKNLTLAPMVHIR